MKNIICYIFYIIGMAMFIAGLALLIYKFGTTAWLYGVLSTLGVIVYTSAIDKRKDKDDN